LVSRDYFFGTHRSFVFFYLGTNGEWSFERIQSLGFFWTCAIREAVGEADSFWTPFSRFFAANELTIGELQISLSSQEALDQPRLKER